MLVAKIFRSKGLVLSVAAAFVLLVTPAMEFAQTPSVSPAGALTGFVYTKDMSAPVANAVVKIRNVGDQKELVSRPSDENGMYSIIGIPQGRYILGVTSPAGDFNFDYVLHLKAGETAKLSVALQEGGQTTGEDAPKKSFFKSPAGIALLITVAAAGLYIAFGKEEAASPIR